MKQFCYEFLSKMQWTLTEMVPVRVGTGGVIMDMSPVKGSQSSKGKTLISEVFDKGVFGKGDRGAIFTTYPEGWLIIALMMIILLD